MSWRGGMGHDSAPEPLRLDLSDETRAWLESRAQVLFFHGQIGPTIAYFLEWAHRRSH